METTSFIWMNGNFVPWDDAKVHVLTHALHYGDAAFEGIRCYKTDRGPAIFRLREHLERLLYSISAFRMELPFSVEQLTKATTELIRMNKLEQGYIRPLVYHGYGIMGLNPRGAPVDAMIACWPWGKYLPHDSVDIKTSSFIRIHPKSTIADAKISGHYVNSILAVLELRGTKYHEALFLDSDGYIAEGPGENFFMIEKGKIITPPLGTILNGITRATVMEYLTLEGIEVIQRPIRLEDAYKADEAFFTGTAAEVSPIRSIDDRVLGNGDVGPISRQVKEAYLKMVQGKDPRFERFLTFA